MKPRLTIPGLVLLALPAVPVLMFVVPPLINARSTPKNLAGLGIGVGIIVWWLVLAIKAVVRARSRNAVRKLLNSNERM